MEIENALKMHISALTLELGVIASPVNHEQVARSILGQTYYVELLRECELRVIVVMRRNRK